MRLRTHSAALVLPFLVSLAPAQIEPQLAGLTRANAALRMQSVDCTLVNAGCPTPLPGANLAWSGGTGYDARSGGFWVSEGQLLARIDPRGCGVSCGPWPAPVIGSAVITGIEVLELTNELLVLDSDGVINVMALDGSCSGPNLISTCSTGLAQAHRVTSGLAADEMQGLVFMSYTDFSSGNNQIAVSHLPTTCSPFSVAALPSCGTPFGSIRGLAVDACQRRLYATDGQRVISMRYFFSFTTMSIMFTSPQCCPPQAIVADHYVGLALRPHPGVAAGNSCSNGACLPCPTAHSLLTGPIVGNSNLLFHLDSAQDSTLTWLLIGFGPCGNGGATIHPLCGPVLVGSFSAAVPLIAGPYPVSGGSASCDASATVVVDFPYAPSFCGSDWSSQFISLCPGSTGTAPFGTAMSNCLSWSVIGP